MHYIARIRGRCSFLTWEQMFNATFQLESFPHLDRVTRQVPSPGFAITPQPKRTNLMLRHIAKSEIWETHVDGIGPRPNGLDL